ncbi:hemagglutinin repeat-containing protein [Arcobacter lanthieri]|uniref:two-partner secretion domain-containing protein n=1 Tax=Aliarcobacter lanthieri TaxID=1355374 RepID=UPI00192348A7|nr:hemagglutinin repeat-containing protein [Aliarcobacter lanthieri]MBL3520783.1 hemagglutinin repeat-containing protein [Aliarcobacter lanthieri]
MKKYIKNIISVNITISLFLQQTLLASGLAVDTNAPKQNQATIEKARNNVPIVNIVKPNEKGLSHNKFNDYNVNKEGLILNNSNKREVNTQLSGYIYGNENLKNSNTAKTILNEVTSKNQTHLKGFTEVAGDRANVVVANPNGIYINGAGFINTQKATITTGNPNIINGQISGYEIRQGYINIDGEGLNTSNINKAELYANAVKINAKIHASDLDIVTGKNSISENGDIKKLSEKDNKNNILSLDSSVLGGIYANKINLVGTSKGVGVNLPIEIIAQDDFKLTTDGKIVLDKVISEKDIKIKSNSSDVNSNIVYGNNVNIEAKESITNKDILASKTNIDLKAKNIINENLIASGVNEDLKDTQNGSLNIKSENLDNKNRIYAKDNIDINSKNIKGLENSSLVAKKDITIKAEDIKNDENTTIQSNNNLSLTTSNFKGNGSKIQASNIDIKSDNIESNNSKITSTNGNITIQSSILDLDNAEQIASTKDINIISNEAKINNSKIFSQNGNILLNSEDLSLNNSNITAFDKIDIKSDILKTKNGNIQALKDINITSKNIDNENGLIATNENINISSQKDGLFNNVKGILQSGKNLSLNIFDFKSDNSNIQASNIDIKANSIESNNSNILSVNSDLVLNANSIIIEDSYIQAKNTLNFNSKNNIELKDNTIISNNLYLSADEINLNGSSQTKNILLSKNDILINTKKLIANYLFTQSNNDININSSNIDLKNSKLQNVAFIGSDYTNGYKQGNINLVTTNLNLYNTNLASNNINIINQANKELTSFVVENSSLDVNNNINIATSNLSSRNSKYLASNNLDLNTNKSIVFLNNHISGNSVNLTVNENLTLDKSNSLEAQNNLNLTTQSLINNAQFISNGSLIINTSDFIVNNSLLNAKHILSLNATNYILNNDSNEEISGIRGAFTNLNTKLLTNYGFISSLYDMNIKVDDLINYGGIASANGENYSSNMNIESKNITNYNTIYSNDNINLYVKNSLKNITDKTKVNLGNEKATIFATNNITMQGDKNRTLRIDEIINQSANIGTQYGDISIFTKKLENLASDPELKGELVQGSSPYIKDGTRINTEIIARDKSGYTYNSYKIYTDIMDFKPYEFAQIISGKDIIIDANNVLNKYSLISANNSIYLNTNILKNDSIDIVKIITTYKDIYIHKQKKRKFRSTKHSSKYVGTEISYDVSIYDTIDSTIQAGDKIIGNINNLQNGVVENKTIELKTYNPTINTKLTTANIQTTKKITDNKSLDEKEQTKNIYLKDKIVINPIDSNYVLPTNKYSMFTTVNPNKNLDYLVESNPLYTNHSNFIGSSYFLEKIDFRGDRVVKRLGDAAYETKLVGDAIFAQIGQRTLNPDFQSENEQFVALMDSAVNLSGILDLELGKPLTPYQIANLTEDIVWMEEQIVNGQIVLVPVVYLANSYDKLNGATIQAKNIDLNIKDNLYNSGTIKTQDYLNLNANSITNNSGVLLSNGKATLISNDDFINKNGGLIKGSDIQIASLNGNVINETYFDTNTINQRRNDFTYTNLGKTSSIEATNGNLIIQAKNDITNIGANLKAKDSVLLQTQSGDINLNAIKLENGHNIYFSGGFDKAKDVEYQTSNIQANNILMQSGNNINLEASKLNADNQINLNALNDVNILALNEEYYRDKKTTTKGTFSKKTKRDMVYKESVNSAELNANDIVINANNSVNLEATKLKAEDNIVVNAKDGDVNILAKEYREGELHERSKSSFGGLKKSLDIKSTDALKLNSALLETQAANVVITSGKDINILASQINSAGDIQLKALDDVLIASQSEYLKTREIHEKSSFSLKGLTALVGTDSSIYSKEIHKNDKLSSSNVASSLNANKDIVIDSGSTTIIGSNFEANNIGIKADTGEINILSSQDVENATSLDKKVEFKLINAKDAITSNLKNMTSGETKLKFEVGSLTYDEVDKASQTTKNNSSNLKARENIVLDSLSDINVVGSNLEAKDNLVLNSAVGDINILNTIDTLSEDVKEKHGKASVNLTVQNEYLETAQAVKSAKESAEQLKQTKDDYSKYKGEVKKLENTLSNLKQSYKNKDVGIDYEDIEDLSDFIDNLKSQEKYYVAAIAAATADLASKTVAIATQAGAAATSSGTLGFSAGVSLDVNGEKSDTTNSNQTSNTSNLSGKNIYINTDEKLSTNTNVVGSNVIADENLYINTNNLNVKASQDNYTSKNDSKSINGSIAFTMYGGGGGTAGLGYGKSNSSSDSLLNNNSQLSGNNVNINVKNDAVFQGANVKANDTLNLNIGNNLVLESLRDEYSSNSKGFNVNAGVGFGSGGKEGHRTPSLDVGKQSSTNAGFSVNNGVTQNKQTIISSITADKVNVNVGNNTHLKGSLLASGNYDEKGIFQDNQNLNLTTNTLTFGNSSNNSYSSNKSLGANVNYNLEDKKVENGQEKAQQKGVSSVGYNSSNSLEANASKTLATLGQGNVTVKDIENSDELDRLNRDTTAVNKDLYSSTTGTKVDATLDTRLLTVEGREQIKKEYEDMNKNMNIIAGTLPDANSDNPIEATVGEIWNGLTKYLTLGIVPSNENNGGILAQIPVLTGVEDSQHKVLQIVNKESSKYNEQDYIRFEDSSYYKSLSDEDKKLFDKQNLYVSKESIIVTKDTATYQNSINGMMNNVGEAIKNGLQQTGQINTNSSPVELNVNYNPSYGFLGDVFESFVDKSGIGTTGIAKQTGGFVYDTTTARGETGSNFAMHSQANAIVYNGIAYVQTTTGFKPISTYDTGTKDGNGKPIYNIPSFISFGSPMNGKDMDKIIKSMGYEYSGAYTKNGDFVGEALGGNKGNNQQADIIDKVNILNAGKLFTDSSPHSTYNCQDFGNGLKCGYKK